MAATQIRPEGGVRKSHYEALIGQKVGTVAKWRLRAVPRVDWGPGTGRFEAVEAGGNTVPRKARYSWTDTTALRQLMRATNCCGGDSHS